MGAPGVGKGTQAKLLCATLKLPHISSGDIFRENISRATKLGKLADDYISRGELVPDRITNAMIRERLGREDCSKGAILDGFPRTEGQAEALEKCLVELGGRIVAVFLIEVPDEVLLERLCGRWMCRAQGHIYHEKHHPPLQPGICDIDGSELYQREDDKAETVARRIHVYMEETAPLIEYFERQGLLRHVNGNQDVNTVANQIFKAIGERVS
ncbi:MAG TPA: adenylate kinase [Anaerolineae bacterium]|nr:adenylate kinase [Anaerolineae bacterium]